MAEGLQFARDRDATERGQVSPGHELEAPGLGAATEPGRTTPRRPAMALRALINGVFVARCPS